MKKFDPSKAYLLHLSGQGDTHMVLVNHETFAWVLNGGEAPAQQVDRIWESNQKYSPNDETREDVARELREITEGSSPHNDRALVAVGDPFGPDQKVFAEYCCGSVRAMMAFLKKVNVELGDEYEGYIY